MEQYFGRESYERLSSTESLFRISDAAAGHAGVPPAGAKMLVNTR